jgi:hypothetical protein
VINEIVSVLIGFGELTAVVLGIFVFWVIHTLTQRRRSGKWRRIAHEISRRYSLAHLPAAEPEKDVASGEHKGIHLEIRLSSEEDRVRQGRRSRASRFAQVDAKPRDFDRSLRIAPRRSQQYDIVDYAGMDRDGQRAGASDLDGLVEIRGASQAVLDGLRESEMVQIVRELLPAGLRVKSGTVSLSIPGLPRAPKELEVHIDRVLRLSARLAELQSHEREGKTNAPFGG